MNPCNTKEKRERITKENKRLDMNLQDAESAGKPSRSQSNLVDGISLILFASLGFSFVLMRSAI